MAILAGAITLFLRRARLRGDLLRRARPTERGGATWARTARELTQVLGQRKLFQKAVPGLMHAFIFWAFLILLPTIAEAMLAVVNPDWTLPYLGHAAWFAFVVDLFAALAIVGVATAFWIRKVQRPARFQGSHLGEADRILLSILAIVVTLLLWNAARIALGDASHPAASPVSNALSGLFSGGGGTETAERVFVWAHLLLVLGFLVYLPGSKHLHILTAAPNVWMAKTGPSGRLERLEIDLEGPEEDLRLGAATAADLSRKQVLDLFSCTECGRCQDVCPTWTTGKPLSPQDADQDLSATTWSRTRCPYHRRRRGRTVELQPIVPARSRTEVVWDCVPAAPAYRPARWTSSTSTRRGPAPEPGDGRVCGSPPRPARLRGHRGPGREPWGVTPQSARLDWADGSGRRACWSRATRTSEVLFWVGCAGAFDERQREVTRATVRLLRGDRRGLRDS